MLFWKCLLFSIFVFNLSHHCNSHKHGICKECGRELVELDTFIEEPISIDSKYFRTFSHLGSVTVQHLENPAGIIFPVVTYREVGCKYQSLWSRENTWFKPYYWSPCFCPQCGTMVGWAFKRNIKQDKPDFYVVIEPFLTTESEVENLIITPKVLRSR